MCGSAEDMYCRFTLIELRLGAVGVCVCVDLQKILSFHINRIASWNRTCVDLQKICIVVSHKSNCVLEP